MGICTKHPTKNCEIDHNSTSNLRRTQLAERFAAQNRHDLASIVQGNTKGTEAQYAEIRAARKAKSGGGGVIDEWQYWFGAIRTRLKGVSKTFLLLTGVRFKALFYKKPTAEEIEAKRKRAYDRVLKNINRTLVDRTTTTLVDRYERDPIVSSYVLARASGICELCGQAARFDRAKDGSPYLEPHHVIMVSKDGPDHPRWVGAVHRECHGELHFGVNRLTLNEKLKNFLASLESNTVIA